MNLILMKKVAQNGGSGSVESAAEISDVQHTRIDLGYSFYYRYTCREKESDKGNPNWYLKT